MVLCNHPASDDRASRRVWCSHTRLASAHRNHVSTRDGLQSVLVVLPLSRLARQQQYRFVLAMHNASKGVYHLLDSTEKLRLVWLR